MVVLPLKYNDPTPVHAEQLFHICVQRLLHALNVCKHNVCAMPAGVYEDACNFAEAVMDCLPSYLLFHFLFRTLLQTAFSFAYITYLWNILAFSRDFHKVP